MADLQQFFLNETFGENSSMQDLIKKVKTCITTVRLGQGWCTFQILQSLVGSYCLKVYLLPDDKF